MEEREAIARLKRGDIGGLEALVRAYQVRAVRAAYLVTRDRAMAEDIVQAAFLRAFARIEQFDAGRPFGPWFLRSVVNDAVKAAAHAGRSLSLEASFGEAQPSFSELLADPRPGPADQVEAAELRRTVWAALEQLPAPQRAAVVLRFYLGMSEAEMSDEMDCPPGTIKWRLHEARRRLKVLLRPHAGEVGGQEAER